MTETLVRIDLQLGPKGQLLHKLTWTERPLVAQVKICVPTAVLKIDFESRSDNLVPT